MIEFVTVVMILDLCRCSGWKNVTTQEVDRILQPDVRRVTRHKAESSLGLAHHVFRLRVLCANMILHIE